VLVLDGAHIGGRISLDAATVVDASGKPGRLALDGLIYAGLPRQPPSAQWLEILQDRTSGYYPQPYRQLAEASRAAGHDAETRKILMAQRTHELRIRRPGMTRTERSWGKFTGVTLGYGYQPWRALVGLPGVVILAVILSVSYGGQGGLAHTRASGSPGTACSALEGVGVGLDFSIPVVRSGAGGACATTASGAGNTITISSWVLQLSMVARNPLHRRLHWRRPKDLTATSCLRSRRRQRWVSWPLPGSGGLLSTYRGLEPGRPTQRAATVVDARRSSSLHLDRSYVIRCRWLTGAPAGSTALTRMF
jgi:hypothetical protein